MSEHTIVTPLSGEEIVEAVLDSIRTKLYRDCHMNPALAYQSFEATIEIQLKLKDQGREPEVTAKVHFILEERPPNAVRQSSKQPIPTLVEDANGRKEIKHVKYSAADQGPGGTQQDPSKREPNPHPPGTPEHEKHEKERKEREEREKKQSERR